MNVTLPPLLPLATAPHLLTQLPFFVCFFFHDHRRFKASHSVQITIIDDIQRVKIPLLCLQRSVWIAGEIAFISSEEESVTMLEAQLTSHNLQPHPKRKLECDDEATLGNEESMDTLKLKV